MCCRYSPKVQYQKQDRDPTQEDRDQGHAPQEQPNTDERRDDQDHGRAEIVEEQKGKTPEVMSE